MSKTFLTQCPHCSTRFRVNSDQLLAAQGAVRCGSCMQVFNARLFLEQDLAAPAPAPASRPEPAPVPAAAPSLDALQIHDDMDLDLDSPDFELELVRLAQQEATEGLPPAGELSAIQEYSTAEDDLPPLHCDNHSATFIDDEDTEEDVFAAPPLYSQYPTISADDEDDAEYLPDEYDLRHEPELGSDNFSAIDDEPLRLDWQPEHRGKGVWLWSLLSVLAALGLATQFVYYNFNELTRQPELRPWLKTACTVLPCTVPGRVDVSLITSSNLVVRPHAEFPNALSVDAIIYNRASFAQPFPLLQLNFMDDKQKTLARRNFHPQEYLGGELAGRSSMPAQTPIRIALDVLVPDANASNYSLKFLSPE